MESDAASLLDALCSDPLFKYMSLDVKARPEGGTAQGAGGRLCAGAACVRPLRPKRRPPRRRAPSARPSQPTAAWRLPLTVRPGVCA